MKVRRILQAGQPGTKKLVKRYGDNMLCVRYRYDEDKMMKYKTIELIIDEKPMPRKTKKKPKPKKMNIRISSKRSR